MFKIRSVLRLCVALMVLVAPVLDIAYACGCGMCQKNKEASAEAQRGDSGAQAKGPMCHDAGSQQGESKEKSCKCGCKAGNCQAKSGSATSGEKPQTFDLNPRVFDAILTVKLASITSDPLLAPPRV